MQPQSVGDVVVPITRAITAKLTFDAYMALERVGTELQGVLRREVTRGEVIDLLMRHAQRVAGSESAEAVAALLAPTAESAS